MNIYEAWCRETSADPKEWSESNPALGQCAVTALVVQDVLGGSIIRGETAVGGVVVGSHYWNYLWRTDIDLTRQQFAFNVEIVNASPRERSYLLSHTETARRYALLCERIGLTPNCDDLPTTSPDKAAS